MAESCAEDVSVVSAVLAAVVAAEGADVGAALDPAVMDGDCCAPVEVPFPAGSTTRKRTRPASTMASAPTATHSHPDRRRGRRRPSSGIARLGAARPGGGGGLQWATGSAGSAPWTRGEADGADAGTGAACAAPAAPAPTGSKTAVRPRAGPDGPTS